MLGLQTVPSLKRCPIFRVSFIERFCCTRRRLVSEKTINAFTCGVCMFRLEENTEDLTCMLYCAVPILDYTSLGFWQMVTVLESDVSTHTRVITSND